jgi:cell wall-associated NlpC family hydrolase
MNTALCCVPVSPLRAEPSHKTEMVSQQVFGECCEILETGKDQWIRIRCAHDGYEGWCQASHVTEIDPACSRDQGQGLLPGWVNELLFDGRSMRVPMGGVLAAMTEGRAVWGPHSVEYAGGCWDPGPAARDSKTLAQIAGSFLNTPYLWGGKTVFGADCSGFSQSVFKFLGIALLRDAGQQAMQGETIGFLQEAKTGDLAFFDNEEGRITHVGILLNDHEIIHASGKVRIDRVDHMGIVHAETFQHTHSLRLIKRFF